MSSCSSPIVFLHAAHVRSPRSNQQNQTPLTAAAQLENPRHGVEQPTDRGSGRERCYPKPMCVREEEVKKQNKKTVFPGRLSVAEEHFCERWITLSCSTEGSIGCVGP
ncbi:hypothetical protein PBY51_021923 [Eleginops maclovinus]|uniref:Uncharacterized protein n=1 Tax=Eleginops maclovinus TaxID=56733 RepID=A0AAN7XFN8_ELEMC|nr:hypothetical protein PBY51_021923 [Eleginops maclovinus]